MKKKTSTTLVTAFAMLSSLWLASGPAAGQRIQGLPQVSPKAVTQQTVGITDIAIEYHRPAVQDRQIWGQLVPYGQVWRAGANDNTTISFSDDVRVEGKALPAGTYGLHMIPEDGKWTVIFSSNHTSWGSFSYEESEDALRVEVQPEAAPFTEWLTYGFEDPAKDSAVVALQWEKVKVPFAVEVDTDELVLAKIRNDLRHLNGFFWEGWMSAANYCAQNDINHEEALAWIDRSLQVNENPRNLMIKARLLMQADRESEVEPLVAQILETGNENQVNIAGYLFLQSGSVDRAIEIFQKNAAAHPESWNVYDSLADAYDNKGEKAKAVSLYKKALERAPENQQSRISGILERLSGS